MAEKKLSFEKSMDRLETIVEKLESGEVALEQSLKLFEEAAGLIKNCQKTLDEAEQRVRKLVITQDGEVSFEDFFDANEQDD